MYRQTIRKAISVVGPKMNRSEFPDKRSFTIMRGIWGETVKKYLKLDWDSPGYLDMWLEDIGEGNFPEKVKAAWAEKRKQINEFYNH